jgi:UDP-3-O-[3-hydroxymyristoyl] N-acetylglucosamine deacetylase
VLGDGTAHVSVVEHLLCALWAAGIDTAVIEVDSKELPNIDGSALPMYEALLEGGREEHGPRPLLNASIDGITVEGTDSFIQLSVGDLLDVHYSFSHPELGEQRFGTIVDRESAPVDLLPARSFITEREADAARAAGFLDNDNEDDALIWRPDAAGTMQPVHPLRFDNELARHKVLDFIGDLYVLPFEWTGCVTAHRSGHKLNRQLARELMQLWRGQDRA